MAKPGARVARSQHLVHQSTTAWPASATCCAFRIFDAATISIALVICAVFLTDFTRRRMSRVLGMNAKGS